MNVLVRFLFIFFMLGLIYFLLGRMVANRLIDQPYLTNVVHPDVSANRQYQYLETANALDSIKSLWGSRKVYPPDLEEVILRSLSHYPELVKTSIEFDAEDIKETINTQPDFWELINPWTIRSYTVRLPLAGSDFSSMDFNAQIGALGLQFSRILYYEQLGTVDLMALGISYPYRDFRIRLNHDLCRITADHGLGWQLLAWIEENLQRDEDGELLQTETNTYFQEFYLTPDELQDYMRELPIYELE